MQLTGQHRQKIEFHELEFEARVAEAHGQEPGPFVYNTDTGEVTFAYTTDDQLVAQVYDEFIPNPLWAKTDDEKRFIELAEKDTWTKDEDVEMKALNRKLTAKMLQQGLV
jgi:hypothetical protein